MSFELARHVQRCVCFPPKEPSNADSRKPPASLSSSLTSHEWLSHICSSCFRLKVWKSQGNMHKSLTFKVSSINVDSDCHCCLVIISEPQHEKATSAFLFTLKYGSDHHGASRPYILYKTTLDANNASQRKSEIKPVKGSQFKVFFACLSNQNRAPCFIITAHKCGVAHSLCKSSLWALSVLTVCWETLVHQNPTLMAFYMRLYISGVKAAWGHVCVSFSCVCFHHVSPAVKGLPARGFPDWEGGSFYGPERSELYESDSGPSVL